MKRLSVIIPVYKVEDYVGQCLQSVFGGGADEREYEVIIVDDGTPDKSMEVVRRVCEGHGNVKIVEQENQGLSAARMAGLSHAEGEYVWFVDSDDWLELSAVDTILKKIALHSDVSVFALPLIWIDAEKRYSDYEADEDKSLSGVELLQSSFPIWAAQRYVTRRDLFDVQSIFFPKGLLHEDEYFCRALLYHAPHVLVLKSSLYYYRQRTNSIMSSLTIRSSYDYVSIYRLLERFLHTDVKRKDERWFRNNIVSFLLAVYKKSFNSTDIESANAFRRLNKCYVLRKSFLCSCYTVKDRIWILRLMLHPKRLGFPNC